jgi:hypothetical protein
MADRVDIVCPCCETRLVADVETGEILSEERPKKDLEKSFSAAMNKVRSGESRREEAFSKAYERTQKLDTLLDKKFEEARKKAKDDDSGEKPHNPMDWD